MMTEHEVDAEREANGDDDSKRGGGVERGSGGLHQRTRTFTRQAPSVGTTSFPIRVHAHTLSTQLLFHLSTQSRPRAASNDQTTKRPSS
jgi:hypothetical protein